mmetsp:Transcript_40391/g.67689  ORF Transcript_40391/g.67689 Transcript_40391/m.67689 type:complete len:83 (-) Transcript_40391:1121-1369(-)
MGFTDALQKAFRTSQHAGLGVGMQVPSHMRGFYSKHTPTVPHFDPVKHVSSLVVQSKLPGPSATYLDVYLTVACPFQAGGSP